MAKIIELETDQNEVDEALKQNAAPETPANPAQPESEMEKVLNTTMKRAYVLGISAGMKAMCGIVMETLNKNGKLNPQRQLSVLRQTVLAHINKQKEFDEKQTAQQTTNKEIADQNKPKTDAPAETINEGENDG